MAGTKRKEKAKTDAAKTRALATKTRRRQKPLTSPEEEVMLALIREGMSMRAIGALEGAPSFARQVAHVAMQEPFALRYAEAKMSMAFIFAEDILDIADDAKEDYDVIRDEATGQVVDYEFNKEHFMRSRLKIDTRKWLLSKLLPKKYGELREQGGSKEEFERAIMGLIQKQPN